MTMAIMAATVWFIPGWLRTADPRPETLRRSRSLAREPVNLI